MDQRAWALKKLRIGELCLDLAETYGVTAARGPGAIAFRQALQAAEVLRPAERLRAEALRLYTPEVHLNHWNADLVEALDKARQGNATDVARLRAVADAAWATSIAMFGHRSAKQVDEAVSVARSAVVALETSDPWHWLARAREALACLLLNVVSRPTATDDETAARQLLCEEAVALCSRCLDRTKEGDRISFKKILMSEALAKAGLFERALEVAQVHSDQFDMGQVLTMRAESEGRRLADWLTDRAAVADRGSAQDRLEWARLADGAYKSATRYRGKIDDPVERQRVRDEVISLGHAITRAFDVLVQLNSEPELLVAWCTFSNAPGPMARLTAHIQDQGTPDQRLAWMQVIVARLQGDPSDTQTADARMAEWRRVARIVARHDEAKLRGGWSLATYLLYSGLLGATSVAAKDEASHLKYRNLSKAAEAKARREHFSTNAGEIYETLTSFVSQHPDPEVQANWLSASLVRIDETDCVNGAPRDAAETLELAASNQPRGMIGDVESTHSWSRGGYHVWSRAAYRIHQSLLTVDPQRAEQVRRLTKHVADQQEAADSDGPRDRWMQMTVDTIEVVRQVDYARAQALVVELKNGIVDFDQNFNASRTENHLKAAEKLIHDRNLKTNDGAPLPLKSAPLVLKMGATEISSGTTASKIDATAAPTVQTIGEGVKCQTLLLSRTAIAELPYGLEVKKLLDARACQSLKRIPADLKVETMVFADCPALEELPWGLQAVMLDVGGCTALKTLPADLKIRYGKLMMRGCTGLISIPNGIDSLELLDVTGCTALLRLPDELEVTTLVATNCTALTELPPKLFIAKGIGHDGGGYDGGKLMLRGCTALKALPASLRRIDFLDISNCPKVTEIPVTLKVKRIELAGSGLRSIPPHLDDVELRWRGVRVTKDIAFHPETITDAAIEATTDDALKRIMLERRSATRH